MAYINKRPPQESKKVTSFDEVQSRFLGIITDDMYLEITKHETEEILDEILIQSLPWIRFTRDKNLFNYDLKKRTFSCELDEIEKEIVVTYMKLVWLQQQIYNVDNIRQKYSGSDFKFTSQASHLKQLVSLLSETKEQGKHLQSDHSRREMNADGVYRTSLSRIMEVY